MLFGETVQSILPQDIPWWSPDFAIFIGIVYLVLFTLSIGLGWVFYRTYRDLAKLPPSCGEPGKKVCWCKR